MTTRWESRSLDDSCNPVARSAFDTKRHAACAATRRRADRWRAKFELLHTVRTHMGASDANYGCVVQREDVTGKVS